MLIPQRSFSSLQPCFSGGKFFGFPLLFHVAPPVSFDRQKSHALHRQCPSTLDGSAGTNTSQFFAFSAFDLANGSSITVNTVHAVVYARHGRELMGCKSPVLESSHCRETE
jgi:hypothetical protein